MIDIISNTLLLIGGFFCLVAGIGVIRLNDVFGRMHAATKAGTLGLALVCISVMLTSTSWLHLAESVFVFLFMIASAPVGAHVIGRAAFHNRQPMDPKTQADPESELFRRPIKAPSSMGPTSELIAEPPDKTPDDQNNG